MFKNALTRLPGKSIICGITGAVNLGLPDYKKALAQHQQYIEALRLCNVEVAVLEPLEDFPDSCFIEDVAVLTPDCAIITSPGAVSRNREPLYVLDAIRRFYEPEQICFISSPGSVDGGDVMMAGSHFYIGHSNRTNLEGCRQFIQCLRKFGYTGEIVPVGRTLHLKTGMSYLENNNLLLSGELAGLAAFKGFNKIVVDIDEKPAANCIWVNGKVIIPAGNPKTKAVIEDAGYQTVAVDISEYQKLDGGLSCLSLRF